MDDKEMKEIIARVSAEVLGEMKSHEAETFRVSDRFKVSDLRAHVKELGSVVDKSAWKVTYDTSSDKITSLKDQISGNVAWKITYDTAGDKIIGREISQ